MMYFISSRCLWHWPYQLHPNLIPDPRFNRIRNQVAVSQEDQEIGVDVTKFVTIRELLSSISTSCPDSQATCPPHDYQMTASACMASLLSHTCMNVHCIRILLNMSQ